MPNLFPDESARQAAFPICSDTIYFSHAGVTALPQCVADTIIAHTIKTTRTISTPDDYLREIALTRKSAATLLNARPDEIALLGPTSLGLSLFANGLDWRPGDEVLCYLDDYPANVYPWLELRRRGVTVRFLENKNPGEITPEIVERSLTSHTRLVALASCNFLAGYRIDHAAIGQLLHEKGILFSLDAIQTLGAFPTTVEHVDFLSADAHKWLLGPMAAGIVYIKREHFERLRPTLLGAWNVLAPQFITQTEIRFTDSARRYEPGVLNIPAIFGMRSAIDMLLGYGIETIAARILEIRNLLSAGLEDLGSRIISPRDPQNQSGILTFHHPRQPTKALVEAFTKEKVSVSHRFDRAGNEYIRLSPHFYNTEAEVARILEILERETK
ncbi:MAG TPA: aminotransferase class V-fold PLP-dependent enzyme [Chthoniobacterales bacterium]